VNPTKEQGTEKNQLAGGGGQRNTVHSSLRCIWARYLISLPIKN